MNHFCDVWQSYKTTSSLLSVKTHLSFHQFKLRGRKIFEAKRDLQTSGFRKRLFLRALSPVLFPLCFQVWTWQEGQCDRGLKTGTMNLTNAAASHNFTSMNNFFFQHEHFWRRRRLTHGAFLKDTLITHVFSPQQCYLFVCLTFVLHFCATYYRSLWLNHCFHYYFSAPWVFPVHWKYSHSSLLLIRWATGLSCFDVPGTAGWCSGKQIQVRTRFCFFPCTCTVF